MGLIGVNPGRGRSEQRKPSTLENIAAAVDMATKILGTGIQGYSVYNTVKHNKESLLQERAKDFQEIPKDQAARLLAPEDPIPEGKGPEQETYKTKAFDLEAPSGLKQDLFTKDQPTGTGGETGLTAIPKTNKGAIEALSKIEKAPIVMFAASENDPEAIDVGTPEAPKYVVYKRAINLGTPDSPDYVTKDMLEQPFKEAGNESFYRPRKSKNSFLDLLAANLAVKEKEGKIAQQPLEIKKLEGDITKTKEDTKRIVQETERAKAQKEIEARGIGSKKTDELFAERLDAWNAGGFASAEKKLNKVSQALDWARKNKNVFGSLTTFLPESSQGQGAIGSIASMARKKMNPELAKFKADVEEGIIGTLRQTLGPQFTAIENELVRRLNIDPTLSGDLVIDQVQTLYNEAKSTAEAMKDAADYWSKNNNTLYGYKRGIPMFGGEQSKKKSGISTEEKRKILREKGIIK